VVSTALHEAAHAINAGDYETATKLLLTFVAELAVEVERLKPNWHQELPCPGTRPE
jgi:hypothetical protein